jgi:hypothetical protein
MRVTTRTAAFPFERQLVILIARFGFGDVLASEAKCRALPDMAPRSEFPIQRLVVILGVDALGDV